MRRFIKKFVTMGVGVAVLASLVSVAAPGVASARCNGVGGYVRSTLIINGGEELVAEHPDGESVCNGNNAYRGVFAAKQPGWRAWVWIQNNNNWVGYVGDYSTSAFFYSYSDDNSHSRIALCADNGVGIVCGWGSEVALYGLSDWLNNFRLPTSGLNHGF